MAPGKDKATGKTMLIMTTALTVIGKDNIDLVFLNFIAVMIPESISLNVDSHKQTAPTQWFSLESFEFSIFQPMGGSKPLSLSPRESGKKKALKIDFRLRGNKKLIVAIRPDFSSSF